MQASNTCLPFTLLAFVLALALRMHAQYPAPVIIDQHLSPHMGANNLVALQKSIYQLEDKYIPATLSKENTLAKKSAGILYRLGKLYLLDLQHNSIEPAER